MTAALEGGEWLAARPGRIYFREKPGTHFTGGFVGPRAGLNGRKISSRTVQPVVSRYTELPGPQNNRYSNFKLAVCNFQTLWRYLVQRSLCLE